MKNTRLGFLLALLIAAPAFGAGDASEALCDNPPSGVTCLCSAPLTGNSGVNTTNFEPAGQSAARSCRTGLYTVDGVSGPDTITSVLASSVTPYPMTVEGSLRVLEWSAATSSQINSPNASFANQTYCQRWYERWDPAWECNDDCNIKGPRWWGDATSTNASVSVQSGLGTSCGSGSRYDFKMYSVDGAGKCATGTTTGCEGCGALRTTNGDYGGQYISFEGGYQTGWIRVDACFDHNLSEAQLLASAPQLTWPGVDHVYMRVKVTQVTGPNARDVHYLGPGYTPFVYDGTVNTGMVATRLFTSGLGSTKRDTTCDTGSWQCISVNGDHPCAVDNDCLNLGFLTTKGKKWNAYFMRAIKATADPNYWIGPAKEVVQDNPPTQCQP